MTPTLGLRATEGLTRKLSELHAVYYTLALFLGPRRIGALVEKKYLRSFHGVQAILAPMGLPFSIASFVCIAS